jgi:hypothetical protein
MTDPFTIDLYELCQQGQWEVLREHLSPAHDPHTLRITRLSAHLNKNADTALMQKTLHHRLIPEAFWKSWCVSAINQENTVWLADLLEHAAQFESPFFLAHHAASRGHLASLDLLLPWVNPKSWDSSLLAIAAHNDHQDCVERLAPLCDADVAMNSQLDIRNWHAVDLLAPYISLEKCRHALTIAPSPGASRSLLARLRVLESESLHQGLSEHTIAAASRVPRL